MYLPFMCWFDCPNMQAIPISYIEPQVWKKAMSVPKGKDGARLRASELMPAYAERWHRAKDDGRAEAALIVLFGLTYHRGIGDNHGLAEVARSAA